MRGRAGCHGNAGPCPDRHRRCSHAGPADTHAHAGPADTYAYAGPADTYATPSPVPTATPEESSAAGVPVFDIDADTRWVDLFDDFTSGEQSCIRNALGEGPLGAALERRASPEDSTEQWGAALDSCLTEGTELGLAFAVLIGQNEQLSEESKDCLRRWLAELDPATLGGESPPGDAQGEAPPPFGLLVGILECAPELASPGAQGPFDPSDAGEPPRWRHLTEGWVVNAPTVADGVAYVGSDDRYVYALDAMSGGVVWRFETGDVIRSSPTVNAGVVYVGSNDNHVYALDAGSGALRWKRDTGAWVQYSPVVSGGLVYVGAMADGGYRVHALDAMTGEEAWVAGVTYPSGTAFTAAVAGGKLYARGDSGEFHTLDASTGELLWSFSAGMGAESPPTVIGGVVYLTSVNTANALDEATGELVWSYGTERFPARDFPAVVSKGAYYFSPDDFIYSLDVATGEPLWSYQADAPINSTPVAADGVVYASSESGRFHALDAATGGLVWSQEPAEWALQSPMVVDGVLYAESSDGLLRALDAATGDEVWQFNKGYFDGIPSYTVAGGVLYVGALDNGVYAFTAPSRTTDAEEVLTLLYWQAPSILNPHLSAGTKDTEAGSITLEPLANYDPEGNLVPALAAEIPTLENGGLSPDLTSITWTLKDGLKWSDGSDVTAEDVVFTWRYCVDEDTGCTSESSFDGVASVEASDRLTVKITFDAPTPYPHNAFVGAVTPVISSAQFADCVGTAATTCEAQNTGPLGTGPYRVIDFKPNKQAVYERNPFYRGAEPYFDRVVLKGGGDAISAARAVLERGEADYAWNLQVEPKTLKEMEAAGLGTLVVSFTSLVERIVLNQTNVDPALEDDRSEYLDGQNPHPFLTFEPIRQAMSMAIDRSLIATQLYGFAAKPTCNLVAGPPNYASTANDACLSQDIEGAKGLLDDNGVLDTDGDDVREYNGVPLRIVYQTSTNAIRQDTQALVRDWWRQIGIEAELVQHDASVFFGGDPVTDKEASYRRFFADVQMYASGTGIDPQQALSAPLCKHISSRENNWSLENVARSCNAEYDALFALLEQTQIGPAREALVKLLNDTYIQSYYEIPLVDRGFVSAHLNTLQGVRINGWDSELWNIAEWRR